MSGDICPDYTASLNSSKFVSVTFIEQAEVFEELDEKGMLRILGHGERASIQALEGGARFLLVAGTPLNEPVARGGPFVMNTEEEIRQAFEDYRRNRF